MYFPHFCGLLPNLTLSNWNALRNTFVTICSMTDFTRHWPRKLIHRLYAQVVIPTMSFIGAALVASNVTVVRLAEKRSINWMALHWQAFTTNKSGRHMQTASAGACRCVPLPESVPLT